MAKNDRILLDGIFEKARPVLPHPGDMGAAFEFFVFNEVLKPFDLSYQELREGHVDGGDDGGIDGFYAFLNGYLLSEIPVDQDATDPHFILYILSVRHRDAFQQAPLNSLLASVPELLNLERDMEDFRGSYNEDLVERIDLFRQSYVALATSHPSIRVEVIYACRGDTTGINRSVVGRRDRLAGAVGDLFSNAEAEVSLLGASELLALARSRPTYSLRLRFVENYIARATGGYVLLAPLREYLRFITDENGRLRRYLFESNVRDYMGRLTVNRAIEETLVDRSNEEDFWWLNNGVTIIASRATVAGKEISLENVQIVNGLQTTESIYNARDAITDDDRAALIKVVVTESDEARDRIIKATNTQTPVETASLRATDPVQRDIEHYLLDFGWYYDRRKNAYKNDGRSADRIVSVSQLGAAVQAVALRLPAVAREQRTRYMRDDAGYRRVFNDAWDLDVFRASWEIVAAVGRLLRDRSHIWQSGLLGPPDQLRYLVAAMFCQRRLGMGYAPENISKLVSDLPDTTHIAELLTTIDDEYADWTATGHRARNTRALARSTAFMARVLGESESDMHERGAGLARPPSARALRRGTRVAAFDAANDAQWR